MVRRIFQCIGLALLFLLTGAMGRAQAVVLLHAYDLTSSLNDLVGSTPLVANGGSITSGGYVFGTNQGLQLVDPLPDLTSFTIALDFRFDATSGYRKVIDFKSRGSDSGFYVLSGNLNYYPITTSAQVDVTPGQPVQVVFTRDGSTSLVTGYVNGLAVISFTDSGNLAVLSSTANGLYFFMDDSATSGEASGGTASRVLVFNGALSASQVLALAQSELPLSIPEPSTVWLLVAGLGGVAATTWLRRRPGT